MFADSVLRYDLVFDPFHLLSSNTNNNLPDFPTSGAVQQIRSISTTFKPTPLPLPTVVSGEHNDIQTRFGGLEFPGPCTADGSQHPTKPFARIRHVSLASALYLLLMHHLSLDRPYLTKMVGFS
jgi:hypothetical protein